MNLQFANNDSFEEEVSTFRKIDLSLLKEIEPKWAFGKNSDKIYDYILHPECQEYIIVKVRVYDLLKNVEFLDFDVENLFIDDLASDYRVVSTLKRWENNQYVDPPTLSINTNNYEKKLVISDGRHRFKISCFLELEKIPIAVHKTILPTLQQLIFVEKL